MTPAIPPIMAAAMPKSMAPLVVLAAGGTGGHMFPAESLASELMSRGVRLALFTDRRGGVFGGTLDALEVHRLHAGAVAGGSLAQRMVSLYRQARGFVQARRLLKRLKPDAVVGFGGYASVPTMLAAVSTAPRMPTVIHEQNAVLGRANRLVVSRVDRIATVFGQVKGVPPAAAAKVVRVGMPVRAAFLKSRAAPYPDLNHSSTIHILVLGGSQGAQVFARVVPVALARVSEALRLRIRVAQQCRREDLDTVRETYRSIGVEAQVSMFFRDVPERLAASHLLIARAGASTVAEMAIVGRPAILVPYPHAADGHQAANALAAAAAGAAWVFPQSKFTPDALAECLDYVFADPEHLYQAVERAWTFGQPEAAERFADVVCELLAMAGGPEGRAAA